MTYAFNHQIEDILALKINLDYDSIPIKTIMGYVKDMNKKDDYKIVHPCVYSIRNLHAYKMVPNTGLKPMRELQALYQQADRTGNPYIDLTNTDHIKKVFYKQVKELCYYGQGYQFEGDINDIWDLWLRYCYASCSGESWSHHINKDIRRPFACGKVYSEKPVFLNKLPAVSRAWWFKFNLIEGKVIEFGQPTEFVKYNKIYYGDYLIANGFTQKQLNKCNKKDLMKLCRSF
jgi:hypothetical protein